MRPATRTHAVAGLVGLVAFAAAARAQGVPQEQTVVLTVVSANERSVYFDHGRDVGLQVGGFVRLFPPGAGEIEVEVRAVSQTSARAELPPGVSLPPVGTRAEARVVVTPAPAAKPSARPQPVVEHPPWTRREDARADDQPLLVPTFRQRPDQRPATLDGRLFVFGQATMDRAGDADSDYLLLRAGLRADATNWLGYGERARFAGEIDERVVAIEGADDSEDRTARWDLASVAFGTEAWAPTGYEFGRFFSPYLPEIGLVDGVEVVRRYQGGVRLGGGLGAYPRPFPARQQGDDLGVHAFVDFTADARRSFAAALGWQKTWHRGAPDRDLFLLRTEWRPAERLFVLGSAKLDYYTSNERVQSAGLEVTEAVLQARIDGDGIGTGLTATRFTWPDLLRSEYQLLPVELVRDGYVQRLSWNGSFRPSASLSLRPRVDWWSDQDRNGSALGLDGDWRGLWNDSSALSVSVFRNDGGYSSGPGARVQVRDRWHDLYWRAGYRWYRYELDSLVSGAETYTRQSVEAGVSWQIDPRTDLDLSVERWFGDREDAFAFAFYLQWRF